MVNHDTNRTFDSAVEETIRQEWGRLLAALTKTLSDLQLAEDSLQDAVESALAHWQRNGLPNTPAAWLFQTARRKAIDRIRRQKNFASKESELAHLMQLDAQSNEKDLMPADQQAIPDQRLEMIFTCCHPAIEEKSRLALTLRTLGGLTTAEIARAFLDKTEAMAARLTRAKKKIALAGIPYEVPESHQLPERLASVLGVVYLIYNEGYHASAEDDLIRTDLTGEAIRLAELLHGLMPQEAETAGLLCLLYLHQARYPARIDGDEDMVGLEHQDRSLWDHDNIKAATTLLKKTLAKGRIGPYQLQAAISACHCEAPSWEKTDWLQIIALYRLLEDMNPSPVVTLNRLVSQSMEAGPEEVLPHLDALSEDLANYQPWHAARADLLRRAGRRSDARIAYQRAIDLSSNKAERLFLIKRMETLDLH